MNNNSKAFREVLEVISHLSKEEYNKIPKEKIELYKEKMDKEYIFKINPQIDLAEQNISKEAKVILINLYRDFFATEEQKEQINKLLDQNQIKANKEKREKYNPNDLFKKNNIVEKVERKEEKGMLEIKETFLKKFAKFVKKLLHID